MALKFNGTEPKTIIYNGTSLTNVVCNGVTVWAKAYTLTMSAGEYTSITVYRKTDDGLIALSNGDTIYYGDLISIFVMNTDGGTVESATVNGVEYLESDKSVTGLIGDGDGGYFLVAGNMTIKTLATRLVEPRISGGVTEESDGTYYAYFNIANNNSVKVYASGEVYVTGGKTISSIRRSISANGQIGVSETDLYTNALKCYVTFTADGYRSNTSQLIFNDYTERTEETTTTT